MATQQSAKLVNREEARIEEYPEAAGQTFKKGELVYLVAGKATVCATSATLIAGMALQDATGVVDSPIAIAIAEPGTLYEMNVYHSNPAFAITAITQPGTVFGHIVSDNKHYINIGDTTTTRLVVQSLSKKDAVGDAYGRVLVEVIRIYCQLSSAKM